MILEKNIMTFLKHFLIMKIASKFLILVFAFLIFMYSCKNKNVNSVSKAKVSIEKKITCDINNDNIADTVMLCTIPASLDFFILIKYKLNGQWKEKIINSMQDVRAIVFGLTVHADYIRVRYCDEHLRNNSFTILYDRKTDNFLLINFLSANTKSKIEKRYKIFGDDSIVLSIDAVSICKKSYENFVIYDTLDEFKKEDKMECIKLPYDKDERTSVEIERLLEVPLDTVSKK